MRISDWSSDVCSSDLDAGGEVGHAEEGDGAEVGQGFHQRQRRAGDDRRAGERQGDAEEGRPGAAAEGAADVEGAARKNGRAVGRERGGRLGYISWDARYFKKTNRGNPMYRKRK